MTNQGEASELGGDGSVYAGIDFSVADIGLEQVPEITAFVDIEAPPTGPAAYFVFGTNQTLPADLVADRHQQGLAPLIIVTGGINRHNGIVEGHVLRDLLIERGVPEDVIRVEAESADTWQNVQNSATFLDEAVQLGLPVTAVSKWYHRRAIQILASVCSKAEPLHGLSYEPIYSGVPITRDIWPEHLDGRRRVIREWQETRRRITDGSFVSLQRVNGAFVPR
ncbi:YdcF family protein [Promicromonospora iranensis]|uniref:YdcF family protein n=1 Tax=Promicromonospora iranensis TaxID=1105144 RepID=UPI0023A941AC|nr:YdcF family protein [Promicromonospora iranensis]